MRILILTKRQYTNKDLLDDSYGRLYEIPRELARLGHQVVGLCLSYRLRKEGHIQGEGIDKSPVEWHSLNLGKLIIPGLICYLNRLDNLIREFRPDIIYASSDGPQVINGIRVARKFNIPCLVDLYDNYESFQSTWLPGSLSIFKGAVRAADGVVCV
ncbi:MAG: group 1 glycosyl transferase, partial [Candidatus Electrothrix sp. AR4]|nr:group 1 glycosyl transferase [Candidatus Electrothrix sp. AR4]